jgi:hypothetical protein
MGNVIIYQVRVFSKEGRGLIEWPEMFTIDKEKADKLSALIQTHGYFTKIVKHVDGVTLRDWDVAEE